MTQTGLHDVHDDILAQQDQAPPKAIPAVAAKSNDAPCLRAKEVSP